jgi:hypothetical protein
MGRATKVLFSLLLPSLLVSCQQNSKQAHSYFDSLVMAQVRHLSKAKASVVKKAMLQGKGGQSTFVPDSSAWEYELGIFRQLSAFERPAYRPAYRVEDGIRDGASNLRIRHYQATEKIPVPELRFYYFNEFKNLKKIEAIYRHQNWLYATTRRLSLEFEEIEGESILTSYRIEGTQKMVLGDTVRISIRSEITN